FLGAAAGGIIEGIKPKFHSIDTINILQQALSLLAGALMIVMGLKLLRVFSIRPLKRFNGFGGNLMVQALSRLVASQHRATPLALGVFNGFLPCPLIYAFLAQSAATGSAASGALTMFSLGLGTFPAMLFMGWIGTKLTFKFRHLGVQFAGFMILMFGIITIARAFVPIGSMKHMG
ncbi:MAG: sulfite exporter TauE/SafE family protein, partial [Paracoccaceae bacterium]